MAGRSRPGERVATRERIMTAAEHLFLLRGYLDVTIEDIAAKAGFTRGAVYSSFASKEDLMFAVHERRSVRQDQTARSAIKPSASGGTTLQAFGRSFAREVERAREWSRAELEFLAVAAKRPEMTERIVAQQREGREGFAQFLLELCEQLGVEPPVDRIQFALAVIALQRGLMLEWMVDPEVDIGRVFADTFARLLYSEEGSSPRESTHVAGQSE